MIAAKKIKFRDQWSSNLSFLTEDSKLLTDVAFDSDNGEVETYLNRSAVASETYNGALKRVYGYKWDEVLAPTLTFVKDDYSEFTPSENVAMLDWLTGEESATFMDVYGYGDNEDRCADSADPGEFKYSLLGNFTEVSQYKISNGRVIGYVAKFESVAPWAFSELIQTTYQSLSNNHNATIDIQTTDTNIKIYPKITFQLLSETDSVPMIEISSYLGMSRLTTMQIANVVPNRTITIDCANKVISSDGTTPRVFGNDFNWEWLFFKQGDGTLQVNFYRITQEQNGKNSFTSDYESKCDVSVEYRIPIKCGDL